MDLGEPIEDLLRRVQKFDRANCKAYLGKVCHPRMDFTEEFLDTQSLDRLRHIVTAAFLQASKSRGYA